MIENYKHKYRSRGKFIFVPNERCERRGRRMLKFFSKLDFPAYFYHYKKGGHVAALHAHIENALFFKIDIQNFYYSIARMRVTRALRHWGYPGAGTFSKWSCVFNPIASVPRHVLPIGFVQSPLLATLVLMKSTVVEAIERAIANGVCISVYLDDFIGSHNDEEILKVAYQDIHDTCVSAGLVPNPAKLEPPSVAITAFNCELTHRMARLTEERTTKYQSRPDRTATTDAAFEQYRLLVASENALTSE
jgi:Reverse transcriptase (RNA-dependent DNA polymerase)